MIARIAVRNILRHRLRTAFTVLALAVAVALLADMLMLSRGMEKTFYRVLSSVGYEVRVCPRGTLPFGTDAVIAESGRVVDAIDADARVDRWLRVLGTTLYADSLPLFVMGVEGERQTLYRVIEGEDIARAGDPDGTERARAASTGGVEPGAPRHGNRGGGGSTTGPVRAGEDPRGVPERLPIALNRNAAAALGVAVGDTLTLRAGAENAAVALSRGLDVVVTGLIDIQFDLPGQRTAILPLSAVQRLRSQPGDAASFVLAKLRGTDGFAPVDDQRAVAASLAAHLPDLSVYSMDTLMEALQAQLAYFKQFSLILSTISLLVTFLLVAVVLTIGVGERRGEIAALRSMGFRRRSIHTMILSESAVLLLLGALAGAGLGWVLAGYLDQILTRSPSLPEGYHFFIPAAREIVTAALLSGAAGGAAALLPAVQAARVDVARTLHEEVV